jgi:hypothetical protein
MAMQTRTQTIAATTAFFTQVVFVPPDTAGHTSSDENFKFRPFGGFTPLQLGNPLRSPRLSHLLQAAFLNPRHYQHYY